MLEGLSRLTLRFGFNWFMQPSSTPDDDDDGMPGMRLGDGGLWVCWLMFAHIL